MQRGPSGGDVLEVREHAARARAGRTPRRRARAGARARSGGSRSSTRPGRSRRVGRERLRRDRAARISTPVVAGESRPGPVEHLGLEVEPDPDRAGPRGQHEPETCSRRRCRGRARARTSLGHDLEQRRVALGAVRDQVTVLAGTAIACSPFAPQVDVLGRHESRHRVTTPAIFSRDVAALAQADDLVDRVEVRARRCLDHVGRDAAPGHLATFGVAP